MALDLDRPRDPAGEWFVDLSDGPFRTSISWNATSGFGFFTSDVGYGDRPNERFRTPKLAVRRFGQLVEQWRTSQRVSPPWLMQLRQLVGTPQTTLADALSCNQPSISRFENRNDVKLSTLVAYLEAIGGRLEMRVHFENLDVSLDVPGTGHSGDTT